MSNRQKAADILNDLIQLNNDRVAGFEKALSDIKEENVDLKALFEEYANQSRTYGQELTALVASYGEDFDKGTSVGGTLHRAWIDVKSLFGGNDRESILNEAERGEDAIKKAYTEALSDGDLTAEAESVVRKQSEGIHNAHDKIKALRNIARS
ncbi:ferritin-like domain-containing protein [Deminuibacter soli]|uniref:PA2169 family four-helix-bundle protein n=1 Tax=Deminuibacter soli TaxID=2291815 RepID=A0A3E1NGF3_9BACT|nr:PA2169 family four-helix-bundle protein [Deminuibacter soli]RFM26868.1 PA2169 family four-helix-bundle protein [Deminuibacter soli]